MSSILPVVSRIALRRCAVLALAAALIVSGCAHGSSADATHGRLVVAAAVYPVAYAAERVGGNLVVVRNLTAPGAEPHDLELTPRQIEAIRRADLVVYLSHRFQPAVEEAVASARRRFDALSAVGPLASSPEDARATDPHFWQDPSRMIRAADGIASALAAADGGHAASFRNRAGGLDAELNDLDRAYKAGLASCTRHEIVTSHAAFGYLAARYGLRQIPIAGLDPETEPTPRRLAEVSTLVHRYHATTVFFETLLSPKLAQTIAREAHVGTDALDPIEGVRGSDTYFTVMHRNLAALRRALDCT